MFRDMAEVVCLIADPSKAPLERPLVAEVARALGARPRWLAEDEACEIPVADGDQARDRGALERARQIAAGAPLDVVAVPAADREKRLLVSDMDSTVITVECIDELADVLGIKPEVAAITRRAMAGELDFRAALEARVALLAGLPVSAFDEVYRDRVRLMPGACSLIRTMRARGAVTALVSGGFVPFAERVRHAVGFDLAQANQLEAIAGRLTGRVLEPIHGPDSKRAMLEQLMTAHGLRRSQTMAVGDGANDLLMLAAAGLGVAYRAHGPVARAVRAAINHGDLSALLYLQGIAKREFVA
jgi:phosphoserine phosphatase